MADEQEKRRARQAQEYAAAANKPISLADSLSALQASIATSKETVKAKNIEIPTIKFEMAADAGDVAAMTAAAKEIAKASGYGPFQTKTFVETIVKQNTPTPVVTSTNATTFNPYTPVVTTTPVVTSTPVVTPTPTGLDPATLALIQSLQNQIALLTANTQQAAIDKAALDAAAKKERTDNAILALTDRFSKYNLGSLIPKIRQLAISGASEDTIALQLQETEEYKQRFIGNEERIKKGLKVLDPGTYLGLEDRYRQIIRAYGLKQFDNDSYVTQFISNDVSPEELSSRVVNAVQRVQNADPAVSAMLRQYYNIGATDMVAYVLDPNNQLPKIERQISAAEIGVAAGRQGLTAGVNVAEQLAAQGVTQAEAQRGYSTIADILPQATKLSQIYTGVLDQYNQGEAEQEVFNSLASAQRKRRALTEREIASFSGTSGLSKTALDRQTGGQY